MHHVLMGLPSGNLLLAGGSGEISLWLLQYDIWQPIGDLQDVIADNLKLRYYLN